MSSNFIRISSFVVVAFLISLGFQNCSSPLHDDGVASLASANPFEYPYAKKQNFYVNAVLMAAESEVESLRQFKVVASAAYAEDASQSIDYNVSVTDSNGMIACPSQSGVLIEGKSAIEFDCTSTALNSEIEIVVEVTANLLTESFSFKF